MARVPSPLRRVWRDRPRLIAVALLALVSLAAAGISATAAERLQSVLDANWRGAYDILVTAEGNDADLAGLLAPNTLSSGADALTLEDLAAIRAVAGVGVAAPIGEVIVPGLSMGSPTITLPKGAAGANDAPQSFRVTLTYRTNDGIGERFVSRETFQVVIDETKRTLPESKPSKDCTVNNFPVDDRYPTLWRGCGVVGLQTIPIVSYPTGGGWSTDDNVDGDTIVVRLGSTPMSATRVTLIDPVAEKALLGTAGDFLDPLISIKPDAKTLVGPLNDWAKKSGDTFAKNFLSQEADREALQLGGENAEYLNELRQLYEDNGADFAEYLGPPQKYVPLLVREVGAAPLSLDVRVESFGPTVADAKQGYGYLLPKNLTSDAAGQVVGETEGDVSDLMNPFVMKSVTVPWPGTQKVEFSGTNYRSMGIWYTGALRSADFDLVTSGTHGTEVRLTADGFQSPVPDYSSWPNSVLKIGDDGTIPGMESVFTGTEKLPQVEGGPYAVPVGSFSIEKIAALQSDLSFVPLGAYQAVNSTLIAGSSPHATNAVTMGPGANGLGLVSPQTVAIASLNSAAMWGQDAPISAVRVRVAGVDGYTPGGVAKITGVAQAIAKLGFSATVVAGSSPTDVTVHVDNYAFGVTDPGQKQEVGPLGSVTQRWSELGAAARVDLAVSNTSFAILAIALGAAALLLAAVQLAGVPARRAQESVMRTIGWRRRRIVRWMAAEELVSLVIIAIAGVVALVLASSRSAVTIAVGGSVVALVVTSALAVVLSARPLASGIRPLRRGKRRHRMQEVRAWVISTWRLALRQVAVHRLNAAVQILATVVVAVAASTVTVTIIEGRAAAGASALGVFAVDQAFVAQLGLGAVALVAGIVLAVIARRIDLVARRQQWTTMRAMGWSAGQVRAVQVIEGLLVGIPAVAIAGGLAWWYLHEVARGLIAVALPIGLAAAGVLTVILVLTSWREKK